MLKRSEIQFKYGVRLVINPSSTLPKQNCISAEKLFCYFEVKIIENDLLDFKDSIGIVTNLTSEDGMHIHYLSKSFSKIIEESIKDLGYRYHLINNYVLDNFSYLPKGVPLSFILVPMEQPNIQQINKISYINIEKALQLLLNTIMKLNE